MTSAHYKEVVKWVQFVLMFCDSSAIHTKLLYGFAKNL